MVDKEVRSPGNAPVVDHLRRQHAARDEGAEAERRSVDAPRRKARSRRSRPGTSCRQHGYAERGSSKGLASSVFLELLRVCPMSRLSKVSRIWKKNTPKMKVPTSTSSAMPSSTTSGMP